MSFRKSSLSMQNAWYFSFLASSAPCSLQKLDWKLYGKCTHSYKRKTNISSTMEGCTIRVDNNASEAEVIPDTKKSRKVNHQIH